MKTTVCIACKVPVRGILHDVLILPTTHKVETVTPTVQVKKLRPKGMVSYLPCKSRFFFFFFFPATGSRKRITLFTWLERLRGFVGSAQMLCFEGCVEVHWVRIEKLSQIEGSTYAKARRREIAAS